MHILCVDDEALVRNVTCDMLRDLGHQVSEAASGTEALDRLQQRDDMIDLLLTDIRMPGLDGLRLAQIARTSRPDLRVIYFSAYALVEPESDANSLRLQKPCSLGGLDAALSRMAH
jgi:CheY-like chemotaxis protein